MKIVCAWCGKEIGEKDGKGQEGTSHGICEVCLRELRLKKSEDKSVQKVRLNKRQK